MSYGSHLWAFGPDPGGAGLEGHSVHKKQCPCGWKPGLYFNRRCPDVPCLGAITVDEVAASATAMLESRSGVG